MPQKGPSHAVTEKLNSTLPPSKISRQEPIQKERQDMSGQYHYHDIFDAVFHVFQVGDEADSHHWSDLIAEGLLPSVSGSHKVVYATTKDFLYAFLFLNKRSVYETYSDLKKANTPHLPSLAGFAAGLALMSIAKSHASLNKPSWARTKKPLGILIPRFKLKREIVLDALRVERKDAPKKPFEI